MKKRKWTEQESIFLKNQYIREIPLKQIAYSLGRSVTAVNKQLPRAGIRPVKIRVKQESVKKISARSTKVYSKSLPLGQMWYFLEDVIRWLIEQGVKLRPATWGGVSGFFLNDKYVSGANLLYFANQKRVEMGLPIFLAEGVTQE